MRKPRITDLKLETTCTECKPFQWEKLMKGAVRANKRAINSLVKEHLPDLYENLALDFFNPYNYYRTGTHLILVHSAIEYFLKFRD